jgi:hypothetical protein
MGNTLTPDRTSHTPRTPATDSLLDNKLGGYVNPPERRTAVLLQFDGGPQALLLRHRTPKAIQSSVAVKAGLMVTSSGSLSWIAGASWGDIIAEAQASGIL